MVLAVPIGDLARGRRSTVLVLWWLLLTVVPSISIVVRDSATLELRAGGSNPPLEGGLWLEASARGETGYQVDYALPTNFWTAETGKDMPKDQAKSQMDIPRSGDDDPFIMGLNPFAVVSKSPVSSAFQRIGGGGGGAAGGGGFFGKWSGPNMNPFYKNAPFPDFDDAKADAAKNQGWGVQGEFSMFTSWAAPLGGECLFVT